MLAEQYHDLALPLPGQTYLVAHSLTAARIKIPPHWRGKFVTFTSSGADLYVAFGSANVKIESAEVAVVVSEEIAPNWASGDIVPAGASRPFPIPDDPLISHFCVDSSAASGSWSAAVSSGRPVHGGEVFDFSVLGKPLMWLDAGKRHRIDVTAGAVTVPAWYDWVGDNKFAEATNMPDLIDAAGVATGLIRPAVSFVTGSSEKLISTNSVLAAALGGVNPFTLAISFSRGATGAAHTLFSVGTAGSNNGRMDLTLNASDDIVLTRVDSAGNSTTSTVTATVSGAYSYVLTFDGATPLLWVDGTSTALTGTAAGNLGTTTKVTVGCRAYNTSTADQFANAQICDVIVLPTALSGKNLTDFQAWFRRRTGK